LRTFEYLENSEFNLFYNAGTLVLICAESQDMFGVPDSWLAAANLILAARAQGLGTCIIGSAAAGLNTSEARELLKIPESFRVVVPIILGVPAAEGVPAPRRTPRILGWI
jgi:nitroreductase